MSQPPFYPSITCPKCGSVSYNPNDIAQGYCGRCHDWTTETTRPVEDVELPGRDCPECEQGKHANCDTTAWDNLTDQPSVCGCFKEGHAR